MKLKRIRIKEGALERVIEFSSKVNLIFSEENSRGKTTLLRFILYGMGFNIPNTKKFKFERCETELIVDSETVGRITFLRYNADFIEVYYNENKYIYVLPEQSAELHSILFGTENLNILNNILGTFYYDQEKGWTMLNRGVVIGSIHFNIEELIRGLSGVDCGELLKEEIQLQQEREKYKQIFSVAQYREMIASAKGEISYDSYTDELSVEKNIHIIEEHRLLSELHRIDRTLKDNRQFKKYISEMKLVVQTSSGELIPVTENNILGLNDTIDLLIAKRKLISSKLVEIRKNIERLCDEQEDEVEQLAFYESESMIEIFDKKIINLPINSVAVKEEITKLEKRLKFIRKQIDEITKANTDLISSMYNTVVKYGRELEIGDEATIAKSYLFTSNLKELTGAVLHKTVFAFRLAYMVEVEKFLNIKLPIILDSPRGKEVDENNIKIMMNILKRDFPENQIIIASIYKYDFDELNVIKINNRLIE